MRVKIISACVAGVAAAAFLLYIHGLHRSATTSAGKSATLRLASNRPISNSRVEPVIARGDKAPVRAVSRSPDRWYSLYLSTPDRFTFVSQAARAALAGDGRAAMYVGDAIYDCAFMIQQVKRGVDITAEHQRELERLPQDPSLAGVVSGLEKEHFERCRRLATMDAFAGLPQREGGYEQPRYWWDLAVQAGDPGAMARNAIEQFASGKMPDAQAQEVVNRAVLSRDPMALFWMGFALSNGQYSTNTDHGMALTLVACEMGYDCSWNNPAIVGASACKYNYNDPCNGYTDWTSFTAATLGPEKYATVYAQAQELKTYLAAQSDAALAFVKVYHRPGS